MAGGGAPEGAGGPWGGPVEWVERGGAARGRSRDRRSRSRSSPDRRGREGSRRARSGSGERREREGEGSQEGEPAEEEDTGAQHLRLWLAQAAQVRPQSVRDADAVKAQVRALGRACATAEFLGQDTALLVSQAGG